MSSGVPLYYAGVAPDDDILDNLLRSNKRQLEHGASSTLDVRRFLNVQYQQVPLGKMKKVVGALVILVVFILLITLTVGSPNRRSTQPAFAQTSTTLRLVPQNDPRDTSNTPSTHAPTSPRTVTKQPTTRSPGIQVDLNLQCHACALVGTSQTLLGSNAGSLIDSSQCVFRLNTAPTVGFEEDVGRKTTVRIFTLSGLMKLGGKVRQTFAHIDHLKAVVVMGTKRQLCANCTAIRMFHDLERYFENVKFLTVSPSDYPGILRNGNALRSGSSNALALVNRICQKTRVYGVSRERSCSGGRAGNYWDPVRLPVGCNDHATRLEPGRLPKDAGLQTPVWERNTDFYPES